MHRDYIDYDSRDTYWQAPKSYSKYDELEENEDISILYSELNEDDL